MDHNKMNDFLKKGGIKFSKSKEQIWREVFSKKLNIKKGGEENIPVFWLNFLPKRSIRFAVAATILILLGVTYYNYQFKDSLYEGNEITHKISREEIAKIESSTMFESLFLEDQEVDYFFNMYVANQIVDE